MNCPNCKNENVIIEKTDVDNINSYLCMVCGFMSSDVKNYYKPNSSKLITDLTIIDGSLRKWHPSVFINKKGIVMPEGDSEFNWFWVFIPINTIDGVTDLDLLSKMTYERFNFKDAIKNLGDINEDI